MQRDEKTTRHSSPTLTGNVSVQFPPEGKWTGQSVSSGNAVATNCSSSPRIGIMIDGCTTQVCAAASNDCTMPGSAVQISACDPRKDCRKASSGSLVLSCLIMVVI